MSLYVCARVCDVTGAPVNEQKSPPSMKGKVGLEQ